MRRMQKQWQGKNSLETHLPICDGGVFAESISNDSKSLRAPGGINDGREVANTYRAYRMNGRWDLSRFGVDLTILSRMNAWQNPYYCSQIVHSRMRVLSALA